MAVKTQKMGPGLFSLGSAGSLMDATAQLTQLTVKWKANAGDSVETLSGDTVSGDRTYAVTLDGTAYQDALDDADFVSWTWSHRGQEVPFTFEPATSAGRAITGTVTIDPMDVGGDVGKKNTSGFTWDCVGEPELGDSL